MDEVVVAAAAGASPERGVVPVDAERCGRYRGLVPTQHDFRAAAGALRTLAVTAQASAVSVNDVDDDLGMIGGAATDIVHAALHASFLNVTSVAMSSSATADEFDRRAIVCATYTTDMERWRNNMSSWEDNRTTYLEELSEDPHAVGPGLAPGRPTRWPLWVEEG